MPLPSERLGMRADQEPLVPPFHVDIHVRNAGGGGLSVLEPSLGGAALEHGNMAPHAHVLAAEFHGRECLLVGSGVIQKASLGDDLTGADDLNEVIVQGATQRFEIA